MLYNKVETGLFSQFWYLWRVYPFIHQVARKYIIIIMILKLLFSVKYFEPGFFAYVFGHPQRVQKNVGYLRQNLPL